MTSTNFVWRWFLIFGCHFCMFICSRTRGHSWVISLIFSLYSKATLSLLFLVIHTRSRLFLGFSFINYTTTLTSTDSYGLSIISLRTLAIIIATWAWSKGWVIPLFLAAHCKTAFSLLFMIVHAWSWQFLSFSFIDDSSPFACSNHMSLLFHPNWMDIIFVSSWTWSNGTIISHLFAWKCEPTFSLFLMRVHARSGLLLGFSLVNNGSSLASSYLIRFGFSYRFLIAFIATWSRS